MWSIRFYTILRSGLSLFTFSLCLTNLNKYNALKFKPGIHLWKPVTLKCPLTFCLIREFPTSFLHTATAQWKNKHRFKKHSYSTTVVCMLSFLIELNQKCCFLVVLFQCLAEFKEWKRHSINLCWIKSNRLFLILKTGIS